MASPRRRKLAKLAILEHREQKNEKIKEVGIVEKVIQIIKKKSKQILDKLLRNGKKGKGKK